MAEFKECCQRGADKVWKMRKGIFVILMGFWLLLLVSSSVADAQLLNPEWRAGVSLMSGTGEQAPFWVVSNRQGRFLPGRQAAALELALFGESDDGGRFDVEYGMEIFGRQLFRLPVLFINYVFVCICLG